MTVDKSEPVYKQIRNLIIVLLLGISSAGILTGFFLYYYGPSGTYLLKNVMVSPDMINGPSFDDRNPATGKVTKFVFSQIVFSYWDQGQRKWHRSFVSVDDYRLFYDKFADMKSLEADTAAVSTFLSSPPAKLTLHARLSDKDANKTEKAFQEVQFSYEGNLFRVELHTQATGHEWAYFYHPHIYQEVLSLFENFREIVNEQ
jgi:hypothetical protein